MQIFVQPLNDVGIGADMFHFRLLPIPVGKIFNAIQVIWIGNALFNARVQGLFDQVKPPEVLVQEFCVDSKRVIILEILRELITDNIHRRQG